MVQMEIFEEQLRGRPRRARVQDAVDATALLANTRNNRVEDIESHCRSRVSRYELNARV